ncbi:hypothetical protein [Streptomyces sp. MAR4 CNX-425]|uniref:hypothetical protein n=1 Tax=Streptomyces sp. MAR4 CNX-425 TaxID=3406343 RepID=UPI003B50B1C3
MSFGRRVGGAALALVAGVAAGCGGESGGVPASLVVEGEAPAAPYDGPLYVPTAPEWEGEGEPGPEEMRAMAGAAGRALECDGDIYLGGRSDPWPSDDGGATPEEGLAWHWSINGEEPPPYGFRVEREEKNRVLFSHDVDGRTKEAVIVAKDREDRPGWGPETTAQCDPAEFEPADDADGFHEIWTDEQGNRVPVTRVSSNRGPEHCDWQSAHFLTLGEDAHGGRGTTYVRDPKGVLPEQALAAPYDGDAELPEGARDTGYRLDDWRLWVDDEDDSRVYVRTPDGTELWPRTDAGCA